MPKIRGNNMKNRVHRDENSSITTKLTASVSTEDMSKSRYSSSEESCSQTESNSSRVKGCMTIRTLDESLHGDEENEDLRRRARLRRNIRRAGASDHSQVSSVDNLVTFVNESKAELTESSSCHGKIESSPDTEPLRVEFSSVLIREYPVTLGDNPGVSAGPALTIDWEPQDEMQISLADYESSRPPRRNYVEMSIPKDIRMQMLTGSGHTRKEIQVAVRSSNIGRSNRKKTNAMLHMSSQHEVYEMISRGLRNTLTLKKKKKKERRLMELSEKFQRQRVEDAIQAENEAAAEELRLLQEFNELQLKMAAEQQHQIKDSNLHQDEAEDVENNLESPSDDPAISNNNNHPKGIISCVET